MKNIGTISFFVLTLFALGDCQFDNPIDQTPQVERDASLIGTWFCKIDEKDSATAVVTASKKPKYIDLKFTASDGSQYTAEGFESRVGDHRFLNLNFLSANEKGGPLPESRWMPVEIKRQNDRITVRYVNLKYQKEKIKPVRPFIESNINNSDFFQEDTFEYKKIK